MTESRQPHSISFDAFLNQGLEWLEEDMERYPAFDPAAPYKEKNAYFNRANNLFLQRLRLNHWSAEMYYNTMLLSILDYQKLTEKVFNKGMVYANLGIAQVIANKFDLGIAHLLTAQEEDRAINPSFDILNSDLWEQFEHPVIFGLLSSLNSPPYSANLSFDIDDAFLEQLVTEMEQDERIFLEGAIWQISLNLSLNDERPNAYTRGVLYSGLRNLCLVIETLLRKRHYILFPTAKGHRPSLWNFLQRGLRNQAVNDTYLNQFRDAEDTLEFLHNFEGISNSGRSDEAKRLHYLCLIRNFTAHHLDISETVASLSGNQFFDNYYETAFVNVLAALLYLKHNNLI
jgi:hypothetical protein